MKPTPLPLHQAHPVRGVECVAALKALGEETRLRMLALLLNGTFSVNEISERLGVSQYNVSKHLRILREAGLLEIEKRGAFRLYTVTKALRSKVAGDPCTLELGCCSFRFDPPGR